MKTSEVITPEDLRKWLYVELRDNKDNHLSITAIKKSLEQILNAIHSNADVAAFMESYLLGKEQSR